METDKLRGVSQRDREMETDRLRGVSQRDREMETERQTESQSKR